MVCAPSPAVSPCGNSRVFRHRTRYFRADDGRDKNEKKKNKRFGSGTVGARNTINKNTIDELLD